MHDDGDNVGVPPRENLDVGHEARGYRVGEEVRDAFLHRARIRYAANLTGLVFDSDDHHPARRVGERDNGSQHRIRRREVALELEGLPLGAAEQLNDVHNSAEYSEVPSATKLQS
jgi:hypothetical protein